MTPDHASRSHATWSASSTARHWQCPGALALGLMAEEGPESIHAARGTACHEVAEHCLRDGKAASEFIGMAVETKEHTIEVDEELAESAQMYVDYCNLQGLEAAEHWIEERFSLVDLAPPFDAGGTGDCIFYYRMGKLLEVVDLKNGMGLVDAKENPQLRTYGLGAMLKHPELDVERVKVTIVQPRAAHKDGRIRSETFHVADLIDWSAKLLEKMHEAKAAKDELDAINGNSVLFDEWAEKWLRPGKCTFCPAEGFCPKLRRSAVQHMEASLAAKWFDDVPVLSVPSVASADKPNAPDMNDPAQLARDLDAFDEIESWIKARRALAHTLAERGTAIPGYQLSDSYGHRKWACDDETKIASDLLKVAGVEEDAIYNRKLKSPAQIEKVLGAKNKDRIKSMWHKPKTGTSLVKIGKATSPAARPKVEQFLDAGP